MGPLLRRLGQIARYARGTGTLKTRNSLLKRGVWCATLTTHYGSHPEPVLGK